MEYAIFIPSAGTDNPVAVLHFAGINVVNLFTAVLLTDPARRVVVLNDPFARRTHLAHSQARLIFTASYDMALPASLLRDLLFGRSILREHRRRQREGKYRGEQHSQ